MRYFIKEGQSTPYVEVVTEKELAGDYSQISKNLSLLRIEERVRHCKADVFEKFVHGSIFIPAGHMEGLSARFYMDEERLLFISEDKRLEKILQEIFLQKTLEMSCTAQMLFSFIDAIIKDEGDCIDDFEQSLNDKELQMLENVNEIPEGFEHYIQKIRKSLMNINRYYEQLGDLVEMLADSPNDIVDRKSERLFRFLAGRLDRLSADALKLREHSTQLYDMYQARINIRQNKVMQFLTVITTIFMPLTLITGWYGMNFRNMPEIQWKFGYISVIGVSVILIIAEYIIFKKKKWM